VNPALGHEISPESLGEVFAWLTPRLETEALA
jgi:hypothetical protein